MRVHPLGKERNISRDIRIREKPIAICAIWGRMVRDKVNGRNERSCLGGGQRTEDGEGGGGRATTRLSFRCAETRASDCVASRGGQKRSRLCTRHVFSISLFLSSPYLSRRMINSRAIVPYLEPQLFPRTLQRYRGVVRVDRAETIDNPLDDRISRKPNGVPLFLSETSFF